MIRRFLLLISVVLGFSPAVHAQQQEKPDPVQIRAVLHDPLRATAELYYVNESGAPARLNFRPKDFSESLLMLPVDGALVFYDTDTIDPENPAAGLAARIGLPAGLKRAVVIVLPTAPDSDMPYRLLLVDDSAQAFPGGESLVLPLISVRTAVQAGEHRIPLEPGRISRIPAVRRVNEFNMAQTNFYYQHGESWIPFAERQLQYIAASRRIFIIHATPGALQPTVTTLVDTLRAGSPP